MGPNNSGTVQRQAERALRESRAQPLSGADLHFTSLLSRSHIAPPTYTNAVNNTTDKHPVGLCGSKHMLCTLERYLTQLLAEPGSFVHITVVLGQPGGLSKEVCL